MEEGKQNITRTEKLVSENWFQAFPLKPFRLSSGRHDIFDGEKMVKAREEDLINKKAKREAAKKAKREAERAGEASRSESRSEGESRSRSAGKEGVAGRKREEAGKEGRSNQGGH